MNAGNASLAQGGAGVAANTPALNTIMPDANHFARITWNPFFAYLLERVREGEPRQ